MITDLLNSVISFRDNLNNNIREAIVINELRIVKLNTDDQLFNRGVYFDGSPISRSVPYRPLTISIKQSKGQPTDRVTLRDTGDFHNSFEVVTDEDEFYITATDKKTSSLTYKYSDDIFGLTEDNVNKVASEIVLPALLDKLRDI